MNGFNADHCAERLATQGLCPAVRCYMCGVEHECIARSSHSRNLEEHDLRQELFSRRELVCLYGKLDRVAHLSRRRRRVVDVLIYFIHDIASVAEEIIAAIDRPFLAKEGHLLDEVLTTVTVAVAAAAELSGCA
ncbi:MAG: hypothetical protein ACI915_002981 [Gammaproteobacteria bacterium]|jgi:hypothetical protein